MTTLIYMPFGFAPIPKCIMSVNGDMENIKPLHSSDIHMGTNPVDFQFEYAFSTKILYWNTGNAAYSTRGLHGHC